MLHSSAKAAERNRCRVRGGVFGHYYSQNLLRVQWTIHFGPRISSSKKHLALVIDPNQPVGPEARTISEQHNVAFAQYFGADRGYVKNVAIPNRWLHARAPGLEAETHSF